MLYINNFPSASKLFTALRMKIEQRVNSQLQLIDKWLRKNKLTLNLSKTMNLLLFNKQPRVLVTSKFNLLNKKKLASDFVKYLGVWINHKLNWLAYIPFTHTSIAKLSQYVMPNMWLCFRL